AIAQLGTGMFPTTARMLLAVLVPVSEQREALAWQRATANLRLVVSFSLRALLGQHVSGLLLLRACTAFFAAVLAWRDPNAPPAPAPDNTGGGSTVGPFVWMTCIVGSYALLYEAYMTATAAQLREALGPAGVSWYSGVMVLNVVGCAVLGVAVS